MNMLEGLLPIGQWVRLFEGKKENNQYTLSTVANVMEKGGICRFHSIGIVDTSKFVAFRFVDVDEEKKE